MFTIDAAAFTRDMTRGAAAFQTHVRDALVQTTQAAATYAKLSRLYKSHTYGLQSSIHVAAKGAWERDIVADAKYASYVENGNAPRSGAAFITSTRPNGRMRFVIGGTTYFRRRVKPAAPRPFMKEARDRAEPLFDRLCAQAVELMFS